MTHQNFSFPLSDFRLFKEKESGSVSKIKTGCLVILFICLNIVPALSHAAQVTGLTGFYRNGQVFLTWVNASNQSNYYKVYRSLSPIVSGSQLSSCEYLGWTNQSSAEDFDLSVHYGQTYYLRIDSGGPPLTSLNGLFVATTLVNGNYYYAVTVILNADEATSISGANSLSVPIAEQISEPQPVFQQMINISGANVEAWTNFISFKKDASLPPIIQAGFMANDFLLYRNQNNGNQPLRVQWHGGGGDMFQNITTTVSNEMNLNLEENFPSGDNCGYWGANSNFNIYVNQTTVPTTGIDYNFMQQTYEKTIEWAIRNLDIDSNRIYLQGSSAGACGAFLFGLTYPEKIAAVKLSVPCFNVGFQADSFPDNSLNPGEKNRVKIDQLLGTMDDNLPTSLGNQIADVVNGAWLIHQFREKEFPFIYAINGKQDHLVGWTEKPIYYDSVNANIIGGYYFWDNRDHGGDGGTWTDDNFDLFRFKRNGSYPAFANCSLNEDYGHGNPVGGVQYGTVNGALDWQDDIQDSNSTWKVNIFIRDLKKNNNQHQVYPDSATVDVSPCRLQNFHVPPGSLVHWQVIHKNQVIQSGDQFFDSGIITVKGIKVYKDTAQFQLSYSPAQIFFADADSDGYGNVNVTIIAATAPEGYVAENSDCDDNNAAVHPGAADACNGIDDNCNEVIDENAFIATVTPGGSVTICSGTSITLTANVGSGNSYQWRKGNSYQWKKGNISIAGATNSSYTTGIAGNYKVTETNTFNCNATSAITTVIVLSAPAATITPLSDPDICEVGFADLQANGGAGLTYKWKKGGNNISGATNQIYTASIAGTYKVVVTNSGGCSKTSSGVTVIQSCKELSASSNLSGAELKIYPNPTNGKFVIDLQLNGDESAGVLQLVDLIGRIVYEQKIAIISGEFQQEIQLKDAADGMYLVRVVVNGEMYTRQLVLSKQ